MWWCMPLNTELGETEADFFEFEEGLAYNPSFSPTKDI